MIKSFGFSFMRAGAMFGVLVSTIIVAHAQERLPWQSEPTSPRTYAKRGADDTYRPGATYGGGNAQRYSAGAADRSGADDRYDQGRDVYVPPADDGAPGEVYRPGDAYRADPRDEQQSAPPNSDYGYGEPYQAAPPTRAAPPPAKAYREPYDRGYGNKDYGTGPRRVPEESGGPQTYEQGEIISTGHRFFGSVSQGIAKAVEYVFSSQGRPNGYILGEDAGGAFVLGLRYGEGRLHTKDAGTHRIYWQGPSLGYDAGAEGSKAMVLVYNMRDISDVYHRFGGVQGSFYVVGGVSVQLQKYGDVTLAVIRSGVGLRVGANVGYLKYTRAPTWNPL